MGVVGLAVAGQAHDQRMVGARVVRDGNDELAALDEVGHDLEIRVDPVRAALSPRRSPNPRTRPSSITTPERS